jgi:predicted nucleic acid-binding protein
MKSLTFVLRKFAAIRSNAQPFSCNSRVGIQIGIELLEVDHQDLPQLAEEFGLSSYDASYLWLAGQLDGELVTLDRRLERAERLLRQR